MAIGFCTSGSAAKRVTLKPEGALIFARDCLGGVRMWLAFSVLKGVGNESASVVLRPLPIEEARPAEGPEVFRPLNVLAWPQVARPGQLGQDLRGRSADIPVRCDSRIS